jgi:hypothetical protein
MEIGPATREDDFMKRKDAPLKLIVGVAVAVLAAAGCKPSDGQTQSPPGGTNAPQFDRVKKETREAVQAANDYAYAQKTEFVEKMKLELALLKQELDRLTTRVDNSSGATKEEAKSKLQSVRDRSDELHKKLDEVKNSTESTWEDVKAGMKNGFDELKSSLKHASEWVSEKLTPAASK